MSSSRKSAAVPARPRHAALSVARGTGCAPKDFDWVARNIPCQAACPAGTDIPGYLDAIARGDFAGAYRLNLEDNVFPAVLGRVCTRPCEPACRHGWEGLGEPVAICFSKRSAADFLASGEPVILPQRFPSTGRRIAIVGAGAAGLACARDLARYGHAVTVFERESIPGGMMSQGIPPFRLPRELVAREIDQVRAAGVDIRCGVDVGRAVTLAGLVADHDRVVLAAGTLKPVTPDIPGLEHPGVRHGLQFLRAANAGDPPRVGPTVVVIGGGFTAVDCARTAKRLGAERVTVCYRRTADEMYITPGEVAEMAHEGIEFVPQVAPVAILAADGRVSGVRLQRTEPGPRGADGRRGFELVPGSATDIAADTVLLGTGQVADLSWLGACDPAIETEGGRVAARAPFRTSNPAVWMAGDFGLGARSLIDAIADGRRCARALDADVMGVDRLEDRVEISDAEATGRTREMDAIPRQPMPALEVGARGLRDEVDRGYSRDVAQTEAKRCYLCHYKYEIDNELCIYCDRCLKVKPVENCIVKVREMIYDGDGRITGWHRSAHARDYNLLIIDQSQCIRCGACKEVCPVECIDLQKVSWKSGCAAHGAGKELQ